MPQIRPLSSDAVAEITAVRPQGYLRLGVLPTSDPAEVLGAVEDVLRLHRRGEDELDSEALITLGVVVGDVYVRTLGWAWVELGYDGGATAIAVLDPTSTYGNQPMNGVYDIARNANRDIAVAQTYARVAAGEVPPAAPGEALMLP